MNTPDRHPDPIRRLIDIVAHLRGPEGCPWDQAQTVKSLRPYLLEECHELLTAIDDGQPDEITEELGDLLLQVVFIAQLHSESKLFNLDMAAEAICRKMVRRHPHVFADAPTGGMQELDDQWNAIKRSEAKSTPTSLLSGIPTSLPALHRAQKIGEKVARVGFDWQEISGVIDKLKEEIAELEDALHSEQQQQIEAELGDILFSTVNLARHLAVDAETSLRQTISRFNKRFQFIEATLADEDKTPDQVSMERLNELWEQAKRACK